MELPGCHVCGGKWKTRQRVEITLVGLAFQALQGTEQVTLFPELHLLIK